MLLTESKPFGSIWAKDLPLDGYSETLELLEKGETLELLINGLTKGGNGHLQAGWHL